MNDYTNQNGNSNSDYTTVQEMTQESKSASSSGGYSEFSESQKLIKSKDYTTKKTAFTKIKYAQK